VCFGVRGMVSVWLSELTGEYIGVCFSGRNGECGLSELTGEYFSVCLSGRKGECVVE